jgi:3,5-epimerase/4-reductase
MSEAPPLTVLVFGGHSGWVGQKLVALLSTHSSGAKVHVAKSRLENRQDIERELARVQPTHVMNAAGVTGRPNVDWCESHKAETTRVNVIGTLTLIDCCAERGVHLTNFATGCIYHYTADGKFAQGSGVGFAETDVPNFDGSFYSKTKAMVEKIITDTGYDNVLQLRLRMPISDDLHPRSLVTKITKYEKVVNIPNSMTVLADMLPVAVGLALANVVGVHNFTNPGAVSHNEVLAMYRDLVDPAFTWKNFTLEEHDMVVVAKRSNNELDCTKLAVACHGAGIELLPIHEALRAAFQRMAKLQQQAAGAGAAGGQ